MITPPGDGTQQGSMLLVVASLEHEVTRLGGHDMAVVDVRVMIRKASGTANLWSAMIRRHVHLEMVPDGAGWCWMVMDVVVDCEFARERRPRIP